MKTNKIIIKLISSVSVIFTLFILICCLILPYLGISPFFELFGGIILMFPNEIIAIIIVVLLFFLVYNICIILFKIRKFRKAKDLKFYNIKYYNQRKKITNPSEESLLAYSYVDSSANQDKSKLEPTSDSYFKHNKSYYKKGKEVNPKDLKLYVKNNLSLKYAVIILFMIIVEMAFLLFCNIASNKYVKNAERLALNSDYMVKSHFMDDGENIVVDSLMARSGVVNLELPLFANDKKIIYGQNALKSFRSTVKYEISFINSNDGIGFDSEIIKNNTNIISVKFPKNLKYIDAGVLSGATNISTLEVPILNKNTDKDDEFIMYLYGYADNVESISQNTVKEYESIENIIINNGTIKQSTLSVIQNSNSLKSLTIIGDVKVDENVSILFDDKVKLTVDVNIFEELYENSKFKLNDNTNIINVNSENQCYAVLILDLFEDNSKKEAQCITKDYIKDEKVELASLDEIINKDFESKGILENYEGYTINSWQVNIDGSFKDYNLTEYTMDKSIIFKAIWEKKDCKLIIDNQDDNMGFVLGTGDYKYGDIVRLEATPKDGYTFAGWYLDDNLISTLLNYDYQINDKENQLVAKWITNPISIIYDDNKGSYSIEWENFVGSKVTLKAYSKDGYDFVGWIIDNVIASNNDTYIFDVPSSPVEIKANFIPKDGIIYHVKHYIQNVDNDEYTLQDDDKLTGITDELTEALAKNYDGFTPVAFNQEVISGDGSTIVEIKYTRDTYKLLFSSNNTSYGTVSLNGGTYKYGKEISAIATAKAGYYFVGWYENNLFLHNSDTYRLTVPSEDRIIVAKFNPRTDTKYTVKHYQENENRDNYVLYEVEDKTGTTDTVTAAIAKEYAHFKAETFIQRIINGDGTTVVEIRYSRNDYLLQVRSDEPNDKGILKDSVVLKENNNTSSFDSKKDNEARTDQNWSNFRYKKQITYGKKVSISYSFAAADNRVIEFTINGKRYNIYSASDATAINKVFENETIKLDLKVNFESNISFNMIGEIEIWWTAWGCFAEGTKILMYDGTYSNIEDLHVGDVVMSWNFEKGQLEAMPISLYWYHGTYDYAVINLKFTNDTILRIIQSHGLFDIDLNEFVYITTNNYQDYIGHQFVIYDENGYNTVKLVESYITVEKVGSYSLRTACNDNAYAEGFLSLTPEDYKGLLTYFEVGDNLKYDEIKMNADIEKYGLSDYDDWKDYASVEEFIALNGKYLNVLIGKGILKYEDIITLIDGMR